MAWRGSQNPTCESLSIHDGGLNSNHAFGRTESYDYMGPVDEDPRWQVWAVLRLPTGSFPPRVSGGLILLLCSEVVPSIEQPSLDSWDAEQGLFLDCLFDNEYQVNLGVGRPLLQATIILFHEGGLHGAGTQTSLDLGPALTRARPFPGLPDIRHSNLRSTHRPSEKSQFRYLYDT